MATTDTTASGIGPVEGGSVHNVDNPAPLIEAPRKRTKKSPKSTRGNFEMYGWLFMRLSGIVLVVLVLGHLLIQLVLDGGVSKIGFAFVAGRWASPFWQVWDLLMLWLAMPRRQRPAHGHQRLRGAREHPAVAQGPALHRHGVHHPAGHAGDLHLRPEHPLGTGLR